MEPAGGQAGGMGSSRPEGDRSRAGRTYFSCPASHKYCCISLVTPKPCAAASSSPPVGPGLALTALPAFGGDFPRTTPEPRSPRGIQAPVLQPSWFRSQPAAAPGHPGSVPTTRALLGGAERVGAVLGNEVKHPRNVVGSESRLETLRNPSHH